MIDRFLNFLTSKTVLTIVYFVAFILITLVVLNTVYPDKISFKQEYIYLLHFIVLYIDIYLILYIYKTKDFFVDSRFLFLIALNLLIYTPFYIILKQQKIAEQLSIYAYYSMVLWVVCEIWIMFLSNKLKDHE